ncbi:glutathione S-transferase family protein [Pacificoceanicola onchidii]|uniref:glutathione S-transferase family protein n=1 Tax=Pacificoceanicola onchidii TaxID=2562685 RepID=UPI0010A3E404|nr:glutathione S-transferase family protein [Pacificoceanicola onchidii]
MRFILHYAPDNASMIVRLAFEELGLPYETRLVDRAARAQDGAAYRALNPAGLIPCLETETEAGALFETGAILLWLADRHGGLGPGVDAPERGNFLKWLFFVSNTLHPMLRMTFYPKKYAGPDPAAQAALRQTVQGAGGAAMTLQGALALLDAELARQGTPFFFGDRPSALDCYLAPVVRWCAIYPKGETGWFALGAYPALQAMVGRMEARPSARRVAQAEGLGAAPFTAPEPCNPPEGSAT